MKLKNILITAASCVLTAAIAVGGTLAYLTSDDSDVNVMTMGNVAIAQHELQRAEGVEYNAGESGKGNGVKEGALVPFKQNQALLPAVPQPDAINPYTAEATDLFYWGDYVYSGTAGNGLFNDNKLKGVIDKFVFVENTGKNNAFFRTWIAVECPDTIEYDGNTPKDLWINATSSTKYSWNEDTYINIGGTRYLLLCATYTDALKPGQQAHPSLLQVVLTHNVTSEKAALFGDTMEILVLSQAVQADEFENAQTALSTAFGNSHPWTEALQTEVSDDAAFKTALQNKDASTIIVNVTEDVTYDVAAWATDAMGGEKTEQIIINGNGHTITFNQTNSDWNNIVTNGAKLVINNANITNAGHNNGPWNRHDLNFGCEVELNDVNSDKALAFKAGAELNNVTINDANTSDTYAIWIQPNGQTVNINGLTVDMLACTDGRGIKIDEQYLNGAQKLTTLNVTDAIFKTEEKSAILVKNSAGAVINLENVDISGVKADPMYAVWVDEASAAYADLVVVNGGNKIIEGAVEVTTATTITEFENAISGGADAVFVDNANLTLGTINANGADITVNGGSVNFGTTGGFNKGIQHSGVETYNNATIVGSVSLYGEKVVFNNCTFDLTGISDYIWTYGAKVVEFNKCTFNTKGKAILVYNEGTVGSSVVTVNGCTFNASESAYASAVPGQPCAAVEIDSSLIPGTYTLNFVGENVVDTEFSGLVRIKNDGGKNNVVINGATAVELPNA